MMKRLLSLIGILAMAVLAISAFTAPMADAGDMPQPEVENVAATTTAPVTALMAGSVVGAPTKQTFGPGTKKFRTSRSRSPFIP